jgi:hypothetical protein
MDAGAVQLGDGPLVVDHIPISRLLDPVAVTDGATVSELLNVPTTSIDAAPDTAITVTVEA